MIEKKNFDFNNFIEHLDYNIPFSFARYGDGEWNAIFGKCGHNCDGHTYFPDMGRRLKDIIISSPKYIMSIQNLAIRQSEKEIDHLLSRNNVNIKWSNSDILHNTSIKEGLQRFYTSLKNKDIIMVAPNHLRPLNKFFVYTDFIEIPLKNCWSNYQHIKNTLRSKLIKRNAHQVVLFSASMMSNVLVDDMYNEFGQQHYFLDVGSVFEPYVGVSIRSYHKNIVK